MSRQDEARLADILEAVDAIQDYLARGDLHDGTVYDAVRVRLIEIGEAVKGIDPDLLDSAPAVPRKEIARMRDHLAHRYFDTDHAIVQDVVDRFGERAEVMEWTHCLVGGRCHTATIGARPAQWRRLPMTGLAESPMISPG